MVWVRLEDDFADHPKIIEAGPLAAWLWVCSLAYANRHATDGFIPFGKAWLLIDCDNTPEQINKLLDVGLWERTEGGYLIHDYTDYQPASGEIKRERELNAKRQAEFRRRRADARNAARSGDTPTSNAVTGALVTPAVTRESQHPGPGPGPGKSPTETYPSLASLDSPQGGVGANAPAKAKAATKTAGKSKAATPPPESLDPNDADYAAGAEVGLTREQVASKTAVMLDHFRGKGESRSDWHATLRNWLRNAPKYDQPARASPPGQNGHTPPKPTTPQRINWLHKDEPHAP